MKHRLLPAVAVPLILAACGSPSDDQAPGPDGQQTTASAPGRPTGEAPASPRPLPIAAELTRTEWSKAENRGDCAALAFTSDGGVPATPRRATFGGGWGVAFDTPQVRSAYGVAGPGVTEGDRASPDEQAERLLGQWPYFTTLANLPAPSFAGYGVEGASRYPADNPQGIGLNSLAYLRVGGQQCTYNVWSRLGRAHLESLLASLRPL